MFLFAPLSRFEKRRFAKRSFFALPFLFVAFLLVACSNPILDISYNDVPNFEEWVAERLHGRWRAPEGDLFSINREDMTFAYTFGEGPFVEAYIVGIRTFGSAGSSGTIFIRYQWRPTDIGQNEPVPFYYSTVFFQNLAANTGQIALPWTAATGTPTRPTLDTARSYFNTEAMATYVSIWITYTRGRL